MSIDHTGIRISGPLAGFAEGFGTELTLLGYAPASVRLQLKVLADLSDWLSIHGMALGDLRRSGLDRFLRHRRAAGHTRYASIRAVRPMLDYLQRLDVVPRQAPDAALDPIDVTLDRFWRYLTVERALATVTARAYLDMVRPFVRGRLSADCRALRSRTPDCGRHHLVRGGPVSSTKSRSSETDSHGPSIVSRVLHLDGIIEDRLVSAVPSVAGRRLVGLPKGLGSRRRFDAFSRHATTDTRRRLPRPCHSDYVGPARYAVGRSSQAPVGRYRLASWRDRRARQGKLYRTHSFAPGRRPRLAEYLQRAGPVERTGPDSICKVRRPSSPSQLAAV